MSAKLGFCELLERCAEVLQGDAESIKQCNTFRGKWDAGRIGQDAKAEHKERLALAKALRRCVKYHRPNQFGGPARIFDACADSIRAGDSIKAAMADYGLAFVKGKRRG